MVYAVCGCASLMIKVEPYWNVNPLFIRIKKSDVLIKVEPYWNVNMSKLLEVKKAEYKLL